MTRIRNRFVCYLWALVWRHWLHEDDVVVAVAGWRTALVDKYGYSRQLITPCFWVFD